MAAQMNTCMKISIVTQVPVIIFYFCEMTFVSNDFSNFFVCIKSICTLVYMKNYVGISAVESSRNVVDHDSRVELLKIPGSDNC